MSTSVHPYAIVHGVCKIVLFASTPSDKAACLLDTLLHGTTKNKFLWSPICRLDSYGIAMSQDFSVNWSLSLHAYFLRVFCGFALASRGWLTQTAWDQKRWLFAHALYKSDFKSIDMFRDGGVLWKTHTLLSWILETMLTWQCLLYLMVMAAGIILVIFESVFMPKPPSHHARCLIGLESVSNKQRGLI